MKIINKMNLEPVATFPQIAEVLGEREGTVFECYKRALVKLQVELRRKGYKMEDFFGEIRNDH